MSSYTHGDRQPPVHIGMERPTTPRNVPRVNIWPDRDWARRSARVVMHLSVHNVNIQTA